MASEAASRDSSTVIPLGDIHLLNSSSTHFFALIHADFCAVSSSSPVKSITSTANAAGDELCAVERWPPLRASVESSNVERGMVEPGPSKSSPADGVPADGGQADGGQADSDQAGGGQADGGQGDGGQVDGGPVERSQADRGTAGRYEAQGIPRCRTAERETVRCWSKFVHRLQSRVDVLVTACSEVVGEAGPRLFISV